MTFRTPQLMELAGGCNLRDLGGHGTADGREVRRGVLYRSGVLTYLTPSDHNCVARARIRTIVDLRRTDEIAEEPTFWPLPVRNLSWKEAPSLAASQRDAPWERATSAEEARKWMVHGYTGMHEWLAKPLRGIFDSILEEEIPVLYHCAAGKDRTGFCSAVILSLLGVAEETILKEYAFTDVAVDLHEFTTKHRAASLGVTDAQHPFEKMEPDVRNALMSADPVFLKAGLAAMNEKYGSVEGYAQDALGLTADQLEIIRFQLLDD